MATCSAIRALYMHVYVVYVYSAKYTARYRIGPYAGN